MPRRSFTTQVEQAVQDRVRSTVAGMQRQGFPELTLAQFVEDALREHATTVEQEHHGGKPWPVDPHLTRGRPLVGRGDSNGISTT